MFEYLTLDNFNLTNKIVGLRIDLNSPIINNKVVYNDKIIRAGKTLRELLKVGAKVVILSHQGTKDMENCISLKNHLKTLEQEIGKKINFSTELFDDKVQKKIKSLKPGNALLIENLRFFEDETNVKENSESNEDKEKNKNKNKLDELFENLDYYVQDAFSVSHRNHKSMIGPTNVPIIAGRTFERELLHLEKLDQIDNKNTIIVGGIKPNNPIKLIQKALYDKKAHKILLTGTIGELALKIKGIDLGKKEKTLEKNGCFKRIDELKELIEKNENKFEIPTDIAIFDGKKRIEIKIEDLKEQSNQDLINKYEICDIGMDTINSYEKTIKKSKTIFLKGPAGNYEIKESEKGTKELLKLISQTKAYTLIAGGHTTTAAKMFNFIKKMNYASLGGGVLVKYLTKEALPGFDSLKQSFKTFNTDENKHYDFIVLGSNTVDIKVDIPEKLSQVEIGEKIKIKDNFKLSNGGGGINTSIVFSKLKSKIGYLGKISNEFKEILDKTLDKNKIGLIQSKETKRGVAKSILLQTKDQDRVIFTYRGQNDYLDITDFDANKLNSNNFYFTALNGKSFATQIKLTKQIKKQNKNSLICYNPSAYLIKEEKKNLEKLIKIVDIIIFNFDEAKDLTGDRDMSSCLRSVHAMGPSLVVITDGSNGSYAYNGEKEYYQKSKPPKKLVDTTGAGDCFAATFFYFFVKKYGIKASLQYASWNSSALIAKNGTSNGLLEFSELAKTKRA